VGARRARRFVIGRDPREGAATAAGGSGPARRAPRAASRAPPPLRAAGAGAVNGCGRAAGQARAWRRGSALAPAARKLARGGKFGAARAARAPGRSRRARTRRRRPSPRSWAAASYVALSLLARLAWHAPEAQRAWREQVLRSGAVGARRGRAGRPGAFPAAAPRPARRQPPRPAAALLARGKKHGRPSPPPRAPQVPSSFYDRSVAVFGTALAIDVLNSLFELRTTKLDFALLPCLIKGLATTTNVLMLLGRGAVALGPGGRV
jgi:hypothetical protein